MSTAIKRTSIRLIDRFKAAYVEFRNALDSGRQERIEAELDRKQDELRATILQLAAALGADAHEARKALIRESYRASGRVPSGPADS